MFSVGSWHQVNRHGEGVFMFLIISYADRWVVMQPLEHTKPNARHYNRLGFTDDHKNLVMKLDSSN